MNKLISVIIPSTNEVWIESYRRINYKILPNQFVLFLYQLIYVLVSQSVWCENDTSGGFKRLYTPKCNEPIRIPSSNWRAAELLLIPFGRLKFLFSVQLFVVQAKWLQVDTQWMRKFSGWWKHKHHTTFELVVFFVWLHVLRLGTKKLYHDVVWRLARFHNPRSYTGWLISSQRFNHAWRSTERGLTKKFPSIPCWRMI